MKYLLKFNENKNEFFTKISPVESQRLINGLDVDMNSVKNYLEREWKSFTEVEIKEINKLMKFNLDSKNPALIRSDLKKSFYFSIVKISDEWFILNFSSGIKRYDYKCDQFDGLINCIKYLKTNKIIE